MVPSRYTFTYSRTSFVARSFPTEDATAKAKGIMKVRQWGIEKRHLSQVAPWIPTPSRDVKSMRPKSRCIHRKKMVYQIHGWWQHSARAVAVVVIPTFCSSGRRHATNGDADKEYD
jgi:hypothetical protein